MTPLASIDACLAQLDFAAAAAAAEALPAGPARTLRQLRIALGLGETSVHEVMREAASTAATLAPTDPQRGALLTLAFDAALRARVYKHAEHTLSCLSEGLAGEAQVLSLRGKLALARDARDEARVCLRDAHARDAQSLDARLWLAELEYIEGDFERALRLLGPCIEDPTPSPRAAQALRLAAHAHGARADHREEARVLRLVVERYPKAPSLGHDQLSLAFAQAADGDYESCAATLRALWEGAPTSGLGAYARRRLDHLEGAANGKAQRLQQFPTTHQKRNFCGPAVLELCLRFLGIELSQDEIAGVVKRETGTPMYEISAFLAARGIAARRCEVTPARIRSAIDLGLPVIVQEEYSTTSHVAVITGYDPRLGVFIAQDPMTHRPELKAFEWTERSGSLFGNGGIVIVGRTEALDPARLAALDAEGLVEKPHFTALDAVDRRRASLQGAPEDALRDEILEACALAMAEEPGYPLAWARKGRALFGAHVHHPSERTRAQLMDFLQRARTGFRGAEWAHDLHADVLSHDGRLREAFVEMLAAHRADPGDAANLESMADVLRRLGELPDAEARFQEALVCDPGYLRAAENLGALYVAALVHADEGPFTASDELAWVAGPDVGPLHDELAHEGDALRERADWYTSLAVREAPDNPWNALQRGLFLALTEHYQAAAAQFAHAASLRDGPYPRMLEARAAWLAQDTARVAKVAAHVREAFPDSAPGHLWTALLAREAGDAAACFEALVHGVSVLGAGRSQLVDALWDAGLAFGGSEAAAVRLQQVVHDAPHDPDFVRAVAQKVDQEGQRGVAIDLLRAALALAPGDVNVRYRLGALLGEDTATHAEAQALLKEVLRQAPDAAVAKTALAWTYLTTEPQQGFEVLRPALDEGDPKVLEAAGVLLGRAGDAQAGADLRAQALAAFGTEAEGRLALARHHLAYNRFDLAADLMFPLRDGAEGLDQEDVEDALVSSARLSGRQMELHAWLVARCADGVPEHLAAEVYWAYRDMDFELAAAAAQVHAGMQDDEESAQEYEIYAAACLAQAGDLAPLEALAETLDENGVAWANMYHAYTDAKRFDAAADAAAKAHRFAPEDLESLSAWEMHCLDVGDKQGALQAARTAREKFPYQHLGDERLALLLGRDLDVESALRHSERAVGLAPFCHLAQTARAVALFVAGDFAGARQHAARSNALEPSSIPDQWSDAEAILRALAGDGAGLERLIHNRAERCRGWPFKAYDARLRSVAERS
jgi:tetratricopeptide (TPR) repeat protein